MRAHDSTEMENACFRGQPLRLRQLRASDRPHIEALLTHVTAADLRMRFFGQFHRVPPALLDQLTRVDPAQRLTVAAVRYGGRGEESAEILGVARAHRTAEESAEVALLVRSDLKGEGLGSMLLGGLIARCRRWGISRLCAEVMESNTRMLRLARRYGFHRETSDQETCQLVLDLQAHGCCFPGRMQRALACRAAGAS